MKTNKPNYYADILEILQELHTLFPTSGVGKHLSTVADEYGGDLWGVSDKELFYALKKYKAQLELYCPHETNEQELQEIIKDGMNLSASSLLNNEEED